MNIYPRKAITIQTVDGYSLDLEIQKTHDGIFNHMKFLSYYDRDADSSEPRTKLELFLTNEQLAVLCRSINLYSLNLD